MLLKNGANIYQAKKTRFLLGQYDDDDNFLEKLSKFRVGHFPEIFHSREREFPKKYVLFPGIPGNGSIYYINFEKYSFFERYCISLTNYNYFQL